MNVRRFLGTLAKSYLAIGALSVSAYAGANEYPFQQPNWDCCAPQQCCPTQCCPPPPCCEPPACAWGYNPPAYLKCGTKCCDSFLDSLGFRVDFLWWRASVEGLALGSEETVIRSPETALGSETFNRSKIKKPKFKYDPGFRLGLTHNCDCWDLALTWTHYHTKASASGASLLPDDEIISTTPIDYTVFVPYWERIAGVFPDSARSRWSFDLDLVDLEFGHKYYVSSCFVLRPHIGLRGGRIDQGYHVASEASRSGEAPIIGAFDNFISEVHAKNDYRAIGPRIGIDLELNLGCGFAVVGQAAGSVLFGKTERHAREEFTAFTDVGTISTGDSFDYRVNGSNNRLSRTITDLAIGVKWDHCVCWCNSYHPVSLAVLWEHHAYYDFNDFSFGNGGFDITETTGVPITATGGKARGDIFTQGLTIALNVGF